MSKKLQAVQVDENTIIYVEATDDIEVSEYTQKPKDEIETEVQRGGSKGWDDLNCQATMQMTRSFEQIQTTIRSYTQYTLNAFRDAALADVKNVTLEFGVNVSGVGGVPYIATGTVGCNIKVTVECAFPERQVSTPPQQQAMQPARTQRLPQTHTSQTNGHPQPMPRIPQGMTPSSNS